MRNGNRGCLVTSQVETVGGREGDLHEMGVLEQAIPGEIVKHREFPNLVVLGRLLPPHFGPLRTHFPLVLAHPQSPLASTHLTLNSQQTNSTIKTHQIYLNIFESDRRILSIWTFRAWFIASNFCDSVRILTGKASWVSCRNK